jgi:hypothetical protein
VESVFLAICRGAMKEDEWTGDETTRRHSARTLQTYPSVGMTVNLGM